ncbi:mechanosensitive ion channel family protein [Argonema galeatum]|uniref:mechanosensitive ion channel family protein n=1 Tax=Argonema galeatum TaxID=2942762 RepID=UPI002013AEA8|nr:mechanosensitive ion channel family protein [Argonema galeatum]MCL1468769.1 mechanosensitive ion channel [Argonema galeatum A003/A1]
MEQSTLIWGLVLIVGFPLLSVALGEIIERLQRHKNPLIHFFGNFRRWTLPPLAILLVMRKILNLKEPHLFLQVVQSLFWVAVLYTSISLLNVVLTTKKKQYFWQIHVPNLLFQFARTVIIIGIGAYVLGEVWKVDLSSVLTALGVGSLVIALALQDTLSNLVSGFLLIFESPLKLGDWIRFQELEGEVIEINWRAVRLKTQDKDIVIIPNGVLGNETIYNYTMLDPLHAERIQVGFSYKDPPNRVKRVLRSAVLSTKDIVSEHEPEIGIKSYGDFSINYEVRFYIKNFIDLEKIRYEVMSRIYYVAKRNHLTMPYPVSIQYDGNLKDILPQDHEPEILEFLRTVPYFISLEREVINTLAQNATVEYYGADEKIVEAREFDTGFYIIMDGSVLLSVTDIHNQEQEISRLSKGDFFGEMVLLRGEPSVASVTVIDDLKAIAIEPDTVFSLAQKNPKFSLEMNQFVEERRKAARLARGTKNLSNQDTPHNGKARHPLIHRLRDGSN